MKEEMKSAFRSAGFIAAFLVMLTCFLGYSLPAWIFSAGWGDEYRQSALALSIGGTFFGSSMLLLPFCANTAYAVSQVDDIRSSMMHWKAMRSSARRYALAKLAASMCSAAVAAALPFILHAVLWNCIAYPYDPAAHPYQRIVFAAGCIYTPWLEACGAWPVYVWMAGAMGFCAAIWSAAGLAVAVWMPDKLLAVAAPVCVYELLACGMVERLLGVQAPHPGQLYNDGLTSAWVMRVLVMYGIIFGISVLLYGIGLKRRLRYA